VKPTRVIEDAASRFLAVCDACEYVSKPMRRRNDAVLRLKEQRVHWPAPRRHTERSTSPMSDYSTRVAPHVAERIEGAQDMLGRLGARDIYEPNYASEKLRDAARHCVEALLLLGDHSTDVVEDLERAIKLGRNLRMSLGGRPR
jgi:hypothetical protein